jgi:hypothetical protein
MRLIRTTLVLVIAASLTLLPIGASAAGLIMGQNDAESSMHMAASTDVSMDHCCPDDIKAPARTDHYKCPVGFCCAGAIAIGDVRALGFEFLPSAVSGVRVVANQIIPIRSGSPPFRPPRV